MPKQRFVTMNDGRWPMRPDEGGSVAKNGMSVEKCVSSVKICLDSRLFCASRESKATDSSAMCHVSSRDAASSCMHDSRQQALAHARACTLVCSYVAIEVLLVLSSLCRPDEDDKER
jgi:hypothetical protein